MEILQESNEIALVLIPQGRLDSQTAPLLQERMLGCIDDAPSVLVDCSQLDYVSSAGLRVFLMGAKRCKQIQREFAICGLQDAVKEVFEISGFLSILTWYPDRTQAQQALTAAG
jgi:anti-anti-sigma factor